MTDGSFTHAGKLVRHHNQFKTDAMNASKETLTSEFEGTGYTPSASEKISQAVSGLGTSCAPYYFCATIPATWVDENSPFAEEGCSGAVWRLLFH